MLRVVSFDFCESVAVDVVTQRLSFIALVDRIVGMPAQRQVNGQGAEVSFENIFVVAPIFAVTQYCIAEGEEIRPFEQRIKVRYGEEEEGAIAAAPTPVKMESRFHRVVTRTLPFGLRRPGFYTFVLETRQTPDADWTVMAERPTEMIPPPAPVTPPVSQTAPSAVRPPQ